MEVWGEEQSMNRLPGSKLRTGEREALLEHMECC